MINTHAHKLSAKILTKIKSFAPKSAYFLYECHRMFERRQDDDQCFFVRHETFPECSGKNISFILTH